MANPGHSQAGDGELLGFALELAGAARRIVVSAAPDGFSAKSDLSPVTEVDRAVEERLRTMIRSRYPGHGFLGEEGGGSELDAELVWVVDPIDGTKAFVAGLPVYSTLIALARGGRPFLGVMDFPALGERLWRLGDGPAMAGGAVCRTRRAGRDLVMAVSNPEALAPPEAERVRRVREICAFAVYGGSSLAYARLAMGRIDVAVDDGLDPYDYCALVPIIEGAGGRITDWEGAPLTIASGSRIVAAGDRALHDRIVALLRS
jgi:histidinol phosphatase-like enzyme (inositol monophosphatase family)